MTVATITNCYLESVEGQGNRLHFELNEGEHSDWVFIEHALMEVQANGQRALTNIVDACGLRDVEDPQDFMGISIDLSAFRAAVNAARPRRRAGPPPAKPVKDTRPESRGKSRYVYVISCDSTPSRMCKIGIANSPEKRIRQLSTSSPYKLSLEFTRLAASAQAIEAEAHKHFASKRHNGEWFSIDPKKAIRHVNQLIDEVSA